MTGNGVLPPELLVGLLADARRRGEPFASTWPDAVAIVATDPAWRDALNATRRAWERAYDRVPATAAERAVSLLIEDADLVPVVEIRDGCCDHCGTELPERRDRRTIYCSARCRRQAHVARQAEAAAAA
jgi:hypothetical protein